MVEDYSEPLQASLGGDDLEEFDSPKYIFKGELYNSVFEIKEIINDDSRDFDPEEEIQEINLGCDSTLEYMEIIKSGLKGVS